MKLRYISSSILATLLFSGCTPIMDLKVKSEPAEAEIYLIQTEDNKVKEEYIGITDFQEPFSFEFDSETDIKTIIARKYGYVDKEVTIPYTEEYNPDLMIEMQKSKKKKMAYAVPTIDKDTNEVVFSLVYDWGYFDTIENSPNALNVERVVVADKPDEFIDGLDVKKGKLAFVRSFPEVPINKETYVEKIELLDNLIESYKKVKTQEAAEVFMKQFEIKKKQYRELLQASFARVYHHFSLMADSGSTIYTHNEIPKALDKRLKEITTLPKQKMFSEIWLSNVGHGFGKTRLTNSNKKWLDLNPSLTADGSTVYFSSNKNGTTFNIWRLATQGGMGITKITTSSYSDDLAPSVDGKNELVAYQSFPRGEQKPQVWTIQTNGSLPSQLREGENVDICSDGSRILFNRTASKGEKQLWVMNSNGAAETMITVNTDINEKNPSFSPDCQWITYESDESGNQDIFIMKVDGSSKIQLTTNQSVDSMPIWADDGYIYFISNRGLVWGIWRLKALPLSQEEGVSTPETSPAVDPNKSQTVEAQQETKTEAATPKQ